MLACRNSLFVGKLLTSQTYNIFYISSGSPVDGKLLRSSDNTGILYHKNGVHQLENIHFLVPSVMDNVINSLFYSNSDVITQIIKI